MCKIKIKEKLNIENILCLFVIISPVLDMISFVFRNRFNTNFSPSTFIRPLIPTTLMIYLFFKNDKSFKIKSVAIRKSLCCICYYSFTFIFAGKDIKQL